MANNRLRSEDENFRKDVDIAYQGWSRGANRYSPEQLVDKQMADNRIGTGFKAVKNDIATSVRKTAKRK